MTKEMTFRLKCPKCGLEDDYVGWGLSFASVFGNYRTCHNNPPAHSFRIDKTTIIKVKR